MRTQHTTRLPRALAAASKWALGCAGLGIGVLWASAAPANGICAVDRPIQLAYPDIGTDSVPRNAEVLYVFDGLVHGRIRWPDGSWSRPVEGPGISQFRFDVGERLVPGEHEIVLELDEYEGTLLSESYTFRFRVDDAVAPEPDETSQVAMTRVARFKLRSAGYLHDDPAAIDAALADPTDCSGEVATQARGYCGTGNYGPIERVGEYRVEFAAEGPALGYAINDRYVVPPHCRSAFVPESAGEAFGVRVITETGLGAHREYQGELETVISPVPDPLDYSPTDPLACDTGARSGSAPRPSFIAATLFAGTLLLRRHRHRGP